MKITLKFSVEPVVIEQKDSIEPNGDRKQIDTYEDGTTVEETIRKDGTRTIYSNRIASLTQKDQEIEICIANVPAN